MKIAMVSEHASPLAAGQGLELDGQAVHVAELSAALARSGHQITVYTRRDRRGLPNRIDTPDGYTVVHVPAGPAKRIPRDELPAHLGSFARFLDAQWDADRPDLVHAHFWMSGVATQLAARRLKIPAVQTFHALGAVERRHQGPAHTVTPDRMRLEALVARCAMWVVATCTDEVEELMRMGCARRRISVVPSGVDVGLFTPDGPKAPRRQLHRIVSVGKLMPHNGFDELIRAMSSIRDCELVIVGGPGTPKRDPEVRRLGKLAEDCGVADRVLLHGPVARNDMPALLRSADVVAITPSYEPSGIVPLQAMACGIPVVASDVGGMRDIVVNDVTGCLVAPHRPTGVAHAINHLVRDDFLRQSMGAAGRDRARSRYSWDRIAGDTERGYEHLVPADDRQPAAASSA